MKLQRVKKRKSSAPLTTADTIANLMLNGLTGSEIAEELGVDVRIVCFERHKILKTLGLKNDLQFLALAIQVIKEKYANLQAENEILRGMLAV